MKIHELAEEVVVASSANVWLAKCRVPRISPLSETTGERLIQILPPVSAKPVSFEFFDL